MASYYTCLNLQTSNSAAKLSTIVQTTPWRRIKTKYTFPHLYLLYSNFQLQMPRVQKTNSFIPPNPPPTPPIHTDTHTQLKFLILTDVHKQACNWNTHIKKHQFYLQHSWALSPMPSHRKLLCSVVSKNRQKYNFTDNSF